MLCGSYYPECARQVQNRVKVTTRAVEAVEAAVSQVFFQSSCSELASSRQGTCNCTGKAGPSLPLAAHKCHSQFPDYLDHGNMNRLNFVKLLHFLKAVNDNTVLNNTSGLPEEQQKHQQMSQGKPCHTPNHLFAQCNLLKVYNFSVTSLFWSAQSYKV